MSSSDHTTADKAQAVRMCVCIGCALEVLAARASAACGLNRRVIRREQRSNARRMRIDGWRGQCKNGGGCKQRRVAGANQADGSGKEGEGLRKGALKPLPTLRPTPIATAQLPAHRLKGNRANAHSGTRAAQDR